MLSRQCFLLNSANRSARTALIGVHQRHSAALPVCSRTVHAQQTNLRPTRSAATGMLPLSSTVALLTALRYTSVDATSSASIVIVDEQKAASARDRFAREMLTSNYPEEAEQRSLLQIRDIIHTVPYTLSIVTKSEEAQQAEVRQKVKFILNECFDMVHNYLNSYNSESELSRINALPVSEKHVMSPHMKKVLECVAEVYFTSGSCFNPACAPLARRLRAAAVNPKATEADFKISADESELYMLYNSFDIDLTENTIARKHKDAELDFGGINKGYTVDCVVEKLNEAGFEDVFFEWGGDCRASGANINHKPWVVGVVQPPTVDQLRKNYDNAGSVSDFQKHILERRPDSEDSSVLLRVVPLQNESLCTSGDYINVLFNPVVKQAFSTTYDWQQHTMIQPSTTNLAQVSVKSYSCMYADALATACLTKKDPVRVRFYLENYRHKKNRVTDYLAYTRQGARLAHMHEVSKESPTRREERIAGSLPARVVIIGGGLAGCVAAIEAASCGAQVILLEKEAKIGGNSAKATSGMNGWGTRAQAQQGVVDAGKFFERDTYRSGVGGNCDPGLVRMLSVKSADAVKFLTDFGIPLSVLSQLGGASRKRCHRAPDKSDGTPVPIGFTIMRTLEEQIRKKMHSRITIVTHAVVKNLMYKKELLCNGAFEIRVHGVRYMDNSNPGNDEIQLPADSVILATGGFSNDHTNRSLLQEFAPHLSSFPTTNGEWATGDGIKMARELGVELVDMDKVQLHPTGLIDPKNPSSRTKFLGPEALRGSGGVLLNKTGERFVNELDLRSVVSQAIIAQNNEYPGSGGSKFAYCVLNEAAAKLFGKNALSFYWKQLGLFVRVENTEELANLMDCDVDVLRETLTSYEECSTNKSVCLWTHKSSFPCVLGMQGPYYVAYVTPSIHYTMGGCLISSSAEVIMKHNPLHLLQESRSILGLFGAGEVTGGLHGMNRLGGNSLLECVVFGRIAGDRAATIVQRKNVALTESEWTPVILSEVRSGPLFGQGSCVLRFNLPGALQRTGLAVGQFIAIRGEWDGQQLIGYYSPITLPDDRGCLSILVRNDKGILSEWISALQPGDAVEMKACGGLRLNLNPAKKQVTFNRKIIRKVSMIAGGSGVAPMLQISRALLSKPFVDNIDSIRLVYAAEDVHALTYRKVLRQFASEHPEKFSCNFVVSRPPEGWIEEVGFVDDTVLRTSLHPPSNDLLVAICGPPVMQRCVINDLVKFGYDQHLVRTVDDSSSA